MAARMGWSILLGASLISVPPAAAQMTASTAGTTSWATSGIPTNLCSAPPSPGRPACSYYQRRCCFGPNVVGTGLSTLVTASSAAIQVGGAIDQAAGVPGGAATGVAAACAVSLIGAIPQAVEAIEVLERCQANPNDCPADTGWLMTNAANALCTVSACLPTSSPHTIAIAGACALGNIGAQLIECSHFDDFCRDELINSIGIDPNNLICCTCGRQFYENGFLWDSALGPPDTSRSLVSSTAECARRNTLRIPSYGPNLEPGHYRYSGCSAMVGVPAGFCSSGLMPLPLGDPVAVTAD